MKERLKRACFELVVSNRYLYNLAKKILSASPMFQKLKDLVVPETTVPNLGEFEMSSQGSERFLKRIKTYFDGGSYIENLDQDLAIINQHWNISNDEYRIFSHRRILGPLLVRGRRLVHGEVRRYVDPIFLQQREFNASVVRILNRVTEDLRSLVSRTNAVEEKLNEAREDLKKLKTKAEELSRRAETTEEELNLIKIFKTDLNKTMDIFRTELGKMTSDLNVLSCRTNAIEERLNNIEEKISRPDIHTSDYYFLFEEKFRGSREVVKDRLRRYIPYFKGCKRVLDIGCGMGEFLELCKEEGIGAVGIDINEDMIKFCEGKFDVVKSDAIEYLKSLPDKYLDGVMISHLAEHLDPEQLFELLSLCYRKMKYSSYIVIECSNPTSLYSLINFYVDPAHKKPVHPETLKFILEYLGFREVKIEFFEEVEETNKLAKIDSSAVPEEVLKVLNENIEKLNRLLFAPQDYAVVAKK